MASRKLQPAPTGSELSRTESFKNTKRSMKRAESFARKALLSWSDSEKQRQRRKKHFGAFFAGVMAKRWATRIRKQSESLEFWQKQIGSQSRHDMIVYRGAPNSSRHDHGEQQKQGKLPFMIFHPYWTWRLVWDFLLLVLLLYSFITVPLFLAFIPAPSSCNSGLEGRDEFFYFEFACDCVFMVDILISFRTAYFDGKSKEILVTDAPSIALHYMRGFFILDVASSLPYELMLSAGCSSLNGANRFLRGPKIVKLIRLVRIMKTLKISKIRKFLERVRDVLRLNPGVARLVKFLSFVCVLTHYNACLMFYIGELFIDPEEVAAGTPVLDQAASTWISWTTSSKTMPGRGDTQVSITELSAFEQYIISVYWSVVTMTTVGYGDISPKTTPEFAFSTIVIIQGGVTFSWIVGNLATLLARINIRYMKYRNSLEAWEDFFYSEGVPVDLQYDIRRYKMFLYNNPVRKMPSFAETELSPSLKRDLNAHLYTRFLGRMPMFKGLQERDLTEIALLLEPMQFAPGEVIYREGHWDDCMYFVHSGSVDMSMLLLNSDLKSQRQIHLITDPSLSELPNFTPLAKDKKLRRGRGGDVKGSLVWKGLDNLQPSFFHWSITSKTKAFFGENVLHDQKQLRLASAVSESWTTVFRLQKDKLDRLVTRFPEIKKVYKRLSLHSTPCAMKKVVLKIIHARRLMIKERARFNIKVEAATTLPAFDRRFGRCDPYTVIELSPKTNFSPRYQTLVSRNTRYPEWNEVFTYTFAQREIAMRERKLVVKVYDYDAAGEDQLLGYSDLDLTPLIERAGKENNYSQESHWLALTKTRRTRNPLTLLWNHWFHSGPKIKIVAEVILGPTQRRRSSVSKQGSFPSLAGSFTSKTSDPLKNPLIPEPTPQESGMLSTLCYSPWSVRGQQIWRFPEPKVQKEPDASAAERKANAERMGFGIDNQLFQDFASPGRRMGAAVDGLTGTASKYNNRQAKSTAGTSHSGPSNVQPFQSRQSTSATRAQQIRALEREAKDSALELDSLVKSVSTLRKMMDACLQKGPVNANPPAPGAATALMDPRASASLAPEDDVTFHLSPGEMALVIQTLRHSHGDSEVVAKLQAQINPSDQKPPESQMEVNLGKDRPKESQTIHTNGESAKAIDGDRKTRSVTPTKGRLKPLPKKGGESAKKHKGSGCKVQGSVSDLIQGLI